MAYQRRLIDDQLSELFEQLPAIALEGARGVGKTETAKRHAEAILPLDDARRLTVTRAAPETILGLRRPALIDEWQLCPEVWNVVRRAVDDDPSGGQFLLTGSVRPHLDARIHSGAGRIVALRMRPTALCEREVSAPTVSLGALMAGESGGLSGESPLSLSDYVSEILGSGLPGVRGLSDRARHIALRSYVDRAVERDLSELGQVVRRPRALRSWLTAYAAATASTTSYTAILNAATAGEGDKPARQTVNGYREALERIWLLDPVPAWWPNAAPLSRLAQSPKHHLMDPALTATLLGVRRETLLRGEGTTAHGNPATLLGALFESLATLTVRSIAAARELETSHLRTRNGDHEIDLIVEGDDGRVLAIEVKLSGTVDDADVRHLKWLRTQIPDQLVDQIVLTTGPAAYRRSDGVGVVPLALLGP